MTTHWAIDLGTSNTTICEDRSGRPHIVNIPDLAKLEPVTKALAAQNKRWEDLFKQE